MTTHHTQAPSASQALPRYELSLLLYFETQAVDYGGKLEGARMNADDLQIARRWNENGFVQFGRIAYHDIREHSGIHRTHWCVLSSDAWAMAHAERRARCDRLMAKLNVERKGLDHPAAELETT